MPFVMGQKISRAALVLIAADKEVERSRFVGKRVFAAATKPAITAGEALIRQAFSEATVQAGDTEKASSEAAASQRKAGPYKHLITGVSFMLPYTVCKIVGHRVLYIIRTPLFFRQRKRVQIYFGQKIGRAHV